MGFYLVGYDDKTEKKKNIMRKKEFYLKKIAIMIIAFWANVSCGTIWF